jgi:hypothetical protein
VNKFNVITLIILVLVCLGCGSISPDSPHYTVTPLPPIKPSLSTIHAPVTLELKSYLSEAEKAVPKNLNGGEENCSGVSYQYSFKRDPIIFNGIGSTMTYKVNGQYGISMNYCPTCTYLFDDEGTCVIPRVYLSCGVDETMRRMSVSYATNIAINTDYSFKSSTQLQEFKLIDPCEVSFFSFDVTGQLKKQLTPVLTDLENDIDKEIRALNVKPQLQELWKMACNPIPIDKYGYLNINPKNIGLNSLSFNGTKAILDVVISLQPSFTTSVATLTSTKLPNLSKIDADKGFSIDLDIFAGYDSLSNIISNQMQNDTILIKKNAFVIENIKLSGTIDQEITLDVNFGGKRKGHLYLTGKPEYDKNSHEISFPNLEYDLASKNLLLRTAKWILNDRILSIIKEKARFNISNELNNTKLKLQTEINKNKNEDFNLKAEIKELDLTQIFLDDKNIIMRIQTSGKISIDIK